MENNQRIFGLDFMRAIAILMVLCSHILWIYPSSNNLISQICTLFGFWGVEIFFVLSGFLIGKILYKSYIQDDFTLGKVFYFLKRRWFRTLPNYFLILILNIVIAIVIGVNFSHIGSYFLFIQNFTTTMNPFFPESWSLSVEEFTYIFVPFSLFLASFLVKVENKSRCFISVVSILVLIFFSNKIIYNFTTQNTTLTQWNVSLKAVVIYRIDSILVGIMASWVSLNFAKFWQKQKKLIAFLGLILLGFLYVGLGFLKIVIETHPFFWNVLYLPLTSIAFALLLPFLSQWQLTSSWFLKSITFISLISYSIYLLHYSIILQLMKYFVHTTSLSIFQLHLFTLAYLTITIVSSWVLFRFFERPIMNFRDKNK
jgi:peptidoglycan/LPS O-acetylase OafA/YrhL